MGYSEETIVIEDERIYNKGQEISLTEVSAQIVPGKFHITTRPRGYKTVFVLN